MDQFQCTVDCYTTADSGPRDPYQCQFGVFHTTENGDSVRALDIAMWQQNPANGSSYNVLVGTDGTTVRSNDDDYIPWSAGYTGNMRGIHLSAIGRAARTREDWLAHPAQIEAMAQWTAHLHTQYGFPLVWLSAADLRAGKEGFTGHAQISEAWREVDHTDPGAGFPYDVVLSRAQQIVNDPDSSSGEDSMSNDEILAKLNEVQTTLREVLRQLGQPGGWPQGGRRTLYDLTSAIAEKQSIPHTYDTLADDTQKKE